MVETRNIDVTTSISAIEGGTLDVIKDITSGTIDYIGEIGKISGLTVSGGTIGVDTEMVLAADNVTISNVKTFVDSAGTQQFGLVDASKRIVLAPTSTIVVTGTISEVTKLGGTSDVAVLSMPVTTVTATDFDIRDLSHTTDSISIPTSSTVQVDNFPADYIKTTGGTVEIGDRTGFTLSTTSTVPVSYVTDTTSTRPVSFTTPVDVTATDLDIRDLSSATDSVSIPASSTVNVDLFVDSAGTLYAQALTDTSKRLIISPTSTLVISSLGGTSDVALTLDKVGLIKETGGTVEIGDKTGFVLSTTSTVPISFVTDTTSTRPVSFSTPVSVSATDLDIRDLSSVTDSVSIPTSSTVQVGSVEGLTISGGTIGVETEWSPTSTVPISPTFIDSAGTLYDQTLVDTTQRIILAPTSTVQAQTAPTTGSTVESHLISTTSTIPTTFSTPVSVTATDLDIRDLSSAVDSVSIPTSSTVQVDNFPTDYIKTTGGTVEIGDKAGFSLSTTSTVPVSFSTPVSVTATDLDIRDLSSATDSVSIPTTSTVGVDYALKTATSMTSTAIIAGTVATELLAANSTRKSYAVVGNTTWYLGPSGVTTADGFKLAADQSYVDGGQGVYTGAVYGVVASGTAEIRVIETS